MITKQEIIAEATRLGFADIGFCDQVEARGAANQRGPRLGGR